MRPSDEKNSRVKKEEFRFFLFRSIEEQIEKKDHARRVGIGAFTPNGCGSTPRHCVVRSCSSSRGRRDGGMMVALATKTTTTTATEKLDPMTNHAFGFVCSSFAPPKKKNSPVLLREFVVVFRERVSRTARHRSHAPMPLVLVRKRQVCVRDGQRRRDGSVGHGVLDMLERGLDRRRGARARRQRSSGPPPPSGRGRRPPVRRLWRRRLQQ